MPYTKASQKAVDKYVKNNYDSFLVRVPKGEKAKIEAAAKSAGMSTNAIFLQAIADEMGKSR